MADLENLVYPKFGLLRQKVYRAYLCSNRKKKSSTEGKDMTHFARASDHKDIFSSMIRCHGCIQGGMAVAYKGIYSWLEKTVLDIF